MQVRADAIARRYEGERRLMEAVARGDMRAADMVEETTLRLERVPISCATGKTCSSCSIR